jgi:hypothetical protein
MAVFDENGEYTPHYLKEYRKYLKYTFLGYDNSPDKNEYFKHKEYKEFVDLDKLFKNIKKVERKDMIQKGRPKKVNVKEEVQEIREVVQETPTIIDTQETVVVQPTVQRTKYSIRPIQYFTKFEDLNRAFHLILHTLNEIGFIKINAEEFKKLSENPTNAQKTNLLCYSILFDKLSQNGLFQYTDEEYSKLPDMFKKGILLYNA